MTVGCAYARRTGSGALRHPKHDLADMLVRLEPGSGSGDLVEREASVDDRPDSAVAQCRHQVGGKAFGCAGLRRRLLTP